MMKTPQLAVLWMALSSGAVLAEDGYDLWLRYAKTGDAELRSQYQSAIPSIVVPGKGATPGAIRSELKRAIPAILGGTPAFSSTLPEGNCLIVGTLGELQKVGVSSPVASANALGADGFVIATTRQGGRKLIIVCSNTPVAALYGTFHFIRLLQMHQQVDSLEIVSTPKIRRRMLNHWDGLDGRVERGYAGRSLWNWRDLPDESDPRYVDYARACASVGINGVALNSVNAQAEVLSEVYIRKWAALAKVFRPYGIKVYISVRWDSPMRLDELKTADPRDERVAKWWADKVGEIYRQVPDFGGFLVKANSEGQPGPLSYGATHAEGANMLGRALAPHGGIVLWRAFVYDFKIGKDRANCAYDEFTPLDGSFLPNVCVQVKNGPLDFQPREPVSPLFGAMPKTNLALELQITQEYLGHSKHWVYLGPMWSEVLTADTHARGVGSTVGKRVNGALFGNKLSIVAGVANTGDSRNWCGHHGAQANWFAFGRLAWDYSLSPDAIADEWVRATWSNDPEVVSTINEILRSSWETCVNYMTPLGLQFLTKPGHHYGPDPGDHRSSRPFWTNVYYHRADNHGLGVNRSSTGANSVQQYKAPLSALYDDLETCPEEYLLWFHHVAWTHQMRSGRTLWEELQHLYHKGAADCERMSARWKGLKGKVDDRRHDEVSKRFEEQVRNAKEWRDACLAYFRPFAEGKAKEPAFQGR